MKYQQQQLTINFFGNKLRIKYKKFSLKQGNHIYDMQVSNCRYILVDDNDHWYFVADLEPCQALKQLIVSKIKGLPCKVPLKIQEQRIRLLKSFY